VLQHRAAAGEIESISIDKTTGTQPAKAVVPRSGSEPAHHGGSQTEREHKKKKKKKKKHSETEKKGQEERRKPVEDTNQGYD
jgi:outer membrane biosynthesis protein TonB